MHICIELDRRNPATKIIERFAKYHGVSIADTIKTFIAIAIALMCVADDDAKNDFCK